MENIFVFEFQFDDETTQRHELPIGGFDFSNFSELCELIENTYNEIEEIESRYGVHDFGTTQCNPNVYEAIGYRSYEVEKSEVSALLKEWENLLVEMGFEILGPWRVEHGTLE